MLVLFFGVIYAIVTVIGVRLGLANFYFYLLFSIVLMFIQYMVGPKLVEWSMRVRYLGREQYPQLHQTVEDLAKRAGIPNPRLGIADISIPNAFAFGRSLNDGRVCVTEGLLRLLDQDELRAVLGHEITHLKNRDVLTITLLSVIPMILYRIAWHTLFFGSRNRQRGANTALIGLAAFIFYFLTNLLVLYASRIREYFADRGSVILGNNPAWLASGLYKLAYGSARVDKTELKQAEGLKAFFINDPSRGLSEVQELRQLDLDKNGTIDPSELQLLQARRVKLSFGDKLLELLGTHPNMLKRIKLLSAYSG